jgi:hypothetical protein
MELSSNRLCFDDDDYNENNNDNDDDGDIHRNQILKQVEEFR